jgi:hypothetical protein
MEDTYMNIPVQCSCGRKLLIKPKFAGKRVKCPICNTGLVVPEAEVETKFEVIDDIETKFEVVDDIKTKSEVADDVVTDFDVVENEPPRKPSRQAIVNKPHRRPLEDDREERPRKNPRSIGASRKRRYRPEYSSGMGGYSGISINRGIIYGVMIMIVAVVWFVLGLFLGWVFFYPPILFVAGVARVIWGFMGGGDDD